MESLQDNIKALETQINNKNLSKDQIGKYKNYYLHLKKSLRRFEEAIDEIKYGIAEDGEEIEEARTDKDDLDLLGEIEIGDKQEEKGEENNKSEKEGDFLGLNVETNALDLQPPQPTPTVQNQAPIQTRAEAFEFLSDNPSAEDFIKIIK